MIRHTPTEPILRDALLAAARAMAKARHVPLHRVSRACYGDSQFFTRLGRGKCSVTLRQLDKMMAWFHDPANWPNGLPLVSVVTVKTTPWENVS